MSSSEKSFFPPPPLHKAAACGQNQFLKCFHSAWWQANAKQRQTEPRFTVIKCLAFHIVFRLYSVLLPRPQSDRLNSSFCIPYFFVLLIFKVFMADFCKNCQIFKHCTGILYCTFYNLNQIIINNNQNSKQNLQKQFSRYISLPLSVLSE